MGPSARRTRRGRRGSSLVETLVIVVVTAVAILAAAGAVLESAALQRCNSQVRAQAPLLATLLDRVRGTAFSELDSTYGGRTDTIANMPEAPTSTAASYVVADVTTGSTRWQVKRVTVTLTWKGPNGNTSISGSTLVCDREVAFAEETFE